MLNITNEISDSNSLRYNVYLHVIDNVRLAEIDKHMKKYVVILIEEQEEIFENS